MDELGRGECAYAALTGAEKAAMWFGATFDEVKVVHGLVVGTSGHVEGYTYGHAWVEWRGLVADFSQSLDDPIIVPAGLYYEIGQIEPNTTVTYTLTEARRQAMDHGHYGPWDDELNAARVPEDLQGELDDTEDHLITQGNPEATTTSVSA